MHLLACPQLFRTLTTVPHRLHCRHICSQVIDSTDPNKRSQYAAVSFALNDAFTANTNTGLIPASSVRVGIGAFKATANWTSSCARSIAADFTARLMQTCGPAAAMCMPGPAVSLADRFVSVNLPLVTATGGPLFDLSSPSAVQGLSVFVELVVSLVDSAGTPVSTTLSAALPVAQGGVNTWCYGQAFPIHPTPPNLATTNLFS